MTVTAPPPAAAPIRRPRRNSDERRPSRWRVRVLWLVALLVVLGGAVAAVVFAPQLAVARVDVTGTDAVGTDPDLAAAVRDAVAVEPGDPMLLIDVAATRSRVAALPEVASVSVRREWPDVVTVQVAPRRTVALVRVGEASAEVAPGGRVRTVLGAGQPPSALVAALTVDPALLQPAALQPGAVLPEPVRTAAIVLEQVPEPVRPALGDGRLAADGTLEFELQAGGTVRFGPLDRSPAKLQSALTMLTGSVDLACLDVLDLTEPDRPTITLRSGCAIAAPTLQAPVAPAAPTSTTVPGAGSSSGTSSGSSSGSSAGSTTGSTTVPSGSSTASPGRRSTTTTTVPTSVGGSTGTRGARSGG